MSKFRNVGKSQPRPRIVRDFDSQGVALPDIPRVGSSQNKSELKSILPEVQKRDVNSIRERRTSQGNRHSWITQNLFQAPNSQRSNTRNQRVVSGVGYDLQLMTHINLNSQVYNSNKSISEYS